MPPDAFSKAASLNLSQKQQLLLKMCVWGNMESNMGSGTTPETGGSLAGSAKGEPMDRCFQKGNKVYYFMSRILLLNAKLTFTGGM